MPSPTVSLVVEATSRLNVACGKNCDGLSWKFLISRAMRRSLSVIFTLGASWVWVLMFSYQERDSVYTVILSIHGFSRFASTMEVDNPSRMEGWMPCRRRTQL